MDDAELVDKLKVFKKLSSEWSLFLYEPYAKQREFHRYGATHRERLFMAGNQLGKTRAGGAEVAYHLTGLYPDDWDGKRFDGPVRIWVAGVTGESTRDNPQRILLGPTGLMGSGTIPKQNILKTSSARGVPDAVETVLVQHVTGGTSQATFKAYSDGREKWQGETLHLVWYDEEPPMDIYIEGLTRTNTTKGVVFITFTPLLGMSDVVVRFRQEQSPDRVVINMTIDDVGHYTEEEKRRIIASYPPHEREARSRGEPMLGTGRVFPVPEEWVTEDDFPIPDHWARIIGIDFGWDHPTAAAALVLDKETDCIHVTACYRQSRETPIYHAAAIKPWGPFPVSWPHDALQHDKGSGEQLCDIYRRHGLRMLTDRAQFPDDRGNGVEAGIQEMLERMQTGRWKVFKSCHQWFEEFKSYHRKDGKIVKEREDILSATRYAVMMMRFARPKVHTDPKPPRYGKLRRVLGKTWMSA